jgi:hypothetical protein
VLRREGLYSSHVIEWRRAAGTLAGRRGRAAVQPRALAPAERTAILDVLHSDRFADLAPDEVWATLLDQGTYLGSVSTYYRVLREAGRPGSGARRPPIPPPSSLSWWPPGRTRSTPGTSPSCTARRNGPPATCT